MDKPLDCTYVKKIQKSKLSSIYIDMYGHIFLSCIWYKYIYNIILDIMDRMGKYHGILSYNMAINT
jgi:hypothetical protein